MLEVLSGRMVKLAHYNSIPGSLLGTLGMRQLQVKGAIPPEMCFVTVLLYFTLQ